MFYLSFTLFLLVVFSSFLVYAYYSRYGAANQLDFFKGLKLRSRKEGGELEKRMSSYMKRAASDRLSISDVEEIEKILDEDGDMERLLLFYNMLERAYKGNYGALHIEILYKKADLLHRKGELKEALFVYAKLANYTMDLGVFFKMGEIYDFFGKDDLALQYFQKAYNSGKNVYVAKSLGKVYQRLGRFRDAVDCFYDSYKNEEADPEVIFDLGTCLMRSGSYSEALSIFSQIEEDENFKKKVAFSKISIYKEIKNFSSLKATALELLQLNLTREEYLEACYEALRACYRGGEYGEMLFFIDKIKEEDENYVDVKDLERFYFQWKKYAEEIDLYTNGSDMVFGNICKAMVENIGYSFESIRNIRRHLIEITSIDQHGSVRRHILCIFFRKIETIMYPLISEYVDSLNSDMVGRLVLLTSGIFDEECHRKVSARPILLIQEENFLELLKTTVASMNEETLLLETDKKL